MKIHKVPEILDFFDGPLEHFPDRSVRWLLQNKENVQGLIEILAGDIAAQIEFSQLVPLNTSFIPDTLREQESDLVFQVPFRSHDQTAELLIYILIEHQSTVDEMMGFRVLFYMMLIWDAQRRRWDQDKVPKKQRRLHPILPIVFYTGERQWQTPLTLETVMDIPDALRRFLPTYDTLFLSVKETEESALQQTGHPLGWLLTVLQKENASKTAISRALIRAVSELEALNTTEAAQKREAIIYLLSLILHRRPEAEHEELVKLVEHYTPKMEVGRMAQSMAEVLIERGIEQGIAQGMERGIEQGMERGIEQGMERGIEQGMERGIEQGMERGIEQGVRETTVKNILSVLKTRFPRHNRQSVEMALASVLDPDHLTQLLLTAVQIPSFEAFLQALDTFEP